MPATAVAASRGDGDAAEEGLRRARAWRRRPATATAVTRPQGCRVVAGSWEVTNSSGLLISLKTSKESKETVQKFKEIDFFVSHSWSDTGHARKY